MHTGITKFEVFTGEKNGDDLKNPDLAGVATVVKGDQFYVLNLKRVVPRKLYLVRNPESLKEYTIYCGYNTENVAQPFCYPCGVGILDDEFQSYLELRLNALDYPIFMSLFEIKEVA